MAHPKPTLWSDCPSPAYLGPPEKTLHFCSGVHGPKHIQVPICRTLRPPQNQTPVGFGPGGEGRTGRDELITNFNFSFLYFFHFFILLISRLVRKGLNFRAPFLILKIQVNWSYSNLSALCSGQRTTGIQKLMQFYAMQIPLPSPPR